MKRIKRIAVATLAVFATVPSASVMAWGPERTTYTMESPAPSAVFNSITDNPTIGDERNFVRIAEKDSGTTFGDEIKIEPGKEYEVYIGYHNDAATSTNATGKGIAQQVRLSSTFPNELKAGERGSVSAIISAYNTTPEKIWDEAYITADKDVTLSFKAGSAIVYNGWGINGSVLSQDLFTEKGTYLGVDKLDGIVFGCAEYSGHVIYVLKVNEVSKEIPHTGPVEVAMAIAIAVGLGGGLFYLYRTRRTLKKVTDSVKGNNIDAGDAPKDDNVEE